MGLEKDQKEIEALIDRRVAAQVDREIYAMLAKLDKGLTEDEFQKVTAILVQQPTEEGE